VPKLEDPKAFFPFIKQNCIDRKAAAVASLNHRNSE
jgi:hypothetical protein